MVEFTKEFYPDLSRWYQDWGQIPPPYEMLPTYGLIEARIAAGFLIATDCNLALLDFFISNKKSNRMERNQAIDKIVDGLIARGTGIGFRYFKVDTQIEAVRMRALDTGFLRVGEFSSFILAL